MLNKMFITRDSADEDGFKETHIEKATKKATEDQSLELEESLSFKYSPPDLRVARESYEHSLPRRVRDALQPTGYRLGLPGELRSKDGEPAELYHPLSATTDEIAEFGVGVTLYFKNLKFFALVLLICAFATLPAIEQNSEGVECSDVDSTLEGSAYCSTDESLKVSKQGASDLAVVFLMALAVLFSMWYFRWLAQNQDDSSLTTGDYSVVITNPPREVSDPDHYRQHFRQFGDVVLASIVKNNGNLLEVLAKKKVCEQKLNKQKAVKAIKEASGETYFNRRDLGWVESTVFGKVTVASLEKELEDINGLVTAAMNQDYHPWRVYITFNYEWQKMNALALTDVSSYNIAYLNRNSLAPPSGKEQASFKDHILNVNEAHEPDEVLYQNSAVTPMSRLFSLAQSYLICSVFVAIVYGIQQAFVDDAKNAVAAFISITNAVIPVLVKEVTERFEIHLNKSDAQLSAMLKLTVVRCFNSGILVYLTVAYGDRFQDQGPFEQIQGILIADAISTPCLRLLDIPGYYRRYIKAPKVVTQEEMNLLWSPQDWSLAERYTDTLKTVFVGMMYAVPLPSGLFITAGAMITSYWVDKYSLTRIWKRPPSLDASLSHLCAFFMMCTLWMHVFFSRIFFANWPYRVEADKADCGFFICEKDGGSQASEDLTDIYNRLNVIFFVVVAIWFYFLTIHSAVKYYFYDSGYAPVKGDDYVGSTKFRKLSKSSAFVPMVTHASMNDPILMADVSNIPPKYAPVQDSGSVFTDSPSDPSVFSVVNTEEFPDKSDNDLRTLFSQVRYYDENDGDVAVYNTHTSSGGGASGAVSRVQVPKVFSDDQGPLPRGWALKHTSDGKPYYVNHINRTTQWNRPVY